MTSMRRWEKEGQDLLKKIIDLELNKAYQDIGILLPTKKKTKLRSILYNVKSIIENKMKYFSIKRIRYHHELPFTGNIKEQKKSDVNGNVGGQHLP